MSLTINVREGFEMTYNAKANYLFFYLILIICIHSARLPPVTIDIVVTIESLEEGEKLVRRCVLLVKVYGILDCMAIYTKIIKK